METTVVAVGDSVRLEIIFSTKTYHSRVTKRPRIETNEGPPDKHVSITTNVVLYPDSTYPVVLTPFGVYHRQTGDTTDFTMEFTITNVSARPVAPSIVATEAFYFTVDLPTAIAPGDSARARVELTASGLSQSFSKSFTIEFDDPARTRFTVPVRWSFSSVTEPSLADLGNDCE